eukprot:Amastigsp_a508459_1135.p3 type:complete len:115 gc:universal Amastigsp_a508459_1135:1047-703(-)
MSPRTTSRSARLTRTRRASLSPTSGSIGSAPTSSTAARSLPTSPSTTLPGSLPARRLARVSATSSSRTSPRSTAFSTWCAPLTTRRSRTCRTLWTLCVTWRRSEVNSAPKTSRR